MQGEGTERDSQADCELSALREVGSAVGLDTWFCEGPGHMVLRRARTRSSDVRRSRSEGRTFRHGFLGAHQSLTTAL